METQPCLLLMPEAGIPLLSNVLLLSMSSSMSKPLMQVDYRKRPFCYLTFHHCGEHGSPTLYMHNPILTGPRRAQAGVSPQNHWRAPSYPHQPGLDQAAQWAPPQEGRNSLQGLVSNTQVGVGVPQGGIPLLNKVKPHRQEQPTHVAAQLCLWYYASQGMRRPT